MGDFVAERMMGLLFVAMLGLAAAGVFLGEPHGKRVTDEELCGFRLRETTQVHVLAALGQPASRDRLDGAEPKVDVLTYRYESPDSEEVTLFSFEGNRLTDIAASKTLKADGAVAKKRPLPACLTTGRASSEVVPGPWRPEPR